MLIVVSGGPGSGKTTLAHALAGAVGCPAVCRDELKEGLVHAGTAGTSSAAGTADSAGVEPGGVDGTVRAVFFEVLGVLVRAGVSVVAEAAFQDRVWRPGLEPLAAHAELRVVHCEVERALARRRIAARLATGGHRGAHADRELLAAPSGTGNLLDDFTPLSLPGVPRLCVDTAHGYDPPLAEIVAFTRH
ncbi:AAA family ATPase [Kitasatospora sp. NPDC001539]|uniref:AAA family ATPase n=1 Tax=Kitasatospora sp. NPDC001539 TaxID=3154384 RepID=UPI003327ECC9